MRRSGPQLTVLDVCPQKWALLDGRGENGFTYIKPHLFSDIVFYIDDLPQDVDPMLFSPSEHISVTYVDADTLATVTASLAFKFLHFTACELLCGC